MLVVNLTPYEIRLVDEKGEIIIAFPPTGIVAKVINSQEVIGEMFGRPIIKIMFNKIENLPNPSNGVVYIVSADIAKIAKRKDVLAPNMDEATVNEHKKVISTRSFQTFD
jgi:hypothetical protein